MNSKLSLGWVLRAASWRDANVALSDSHQHNPDTTVGTLGHLVHSVHSVTKCTALYRRAFRESRKKKKKESLDLNLSFLCLSSFFPLRFKLGYQSHLYPYKRNPFWSRLSWGKGGKISPSYWIGKNKSILLSLWFTLVKHHHKAKAWTWLFPRSDIISTLSFCDF